MTRNQTQTMRQPVRRRPEDDDCWVVPFPVPRPRRRTTAAAAVTVPDTEAAHLGLAADPRVTRP